MKQHGNILVVGSSEEAEALIRDSQGDRYCFTCCSKDDHTRTSPDQNERRYDWVLINGEALDGDKMDLIRSLAAPGFLNTAGRHGCGVEWLSDGTLQLHCCAQPHARRQQLPAAPFAECADGAMVFEYHAPVKRTG